MRQILSEGSKSKDDKEPTLSANKKTTSIYINPIEWKKFQTYMKNLKTTANAEVERFVKKRNAEYEGKEIIFEENLETLKAERLKLKKHAYDLQKFLIRMLPNRRSIYETLCAFSGTDRALKHNLDKALAKMEVYICDGSEPFMDTHVEDFVSYLETVKKIREIEADIKARRQKLSKSNSKT